MLTAGESLFLCFHRLHKDQRVMAHPWGRGEAANAIWIFIRKSADLRSVMTNGRATQIKVLVFCNPFVSGSTSSKKWIGKKPHPQQALGKEASLYWAQTVPFVVVDNWLGYFQPREACVCGERYFVFLNLRYSALYKVFERSARKN